MSDLTEFRDHCRAMAASDAQVAGSIEVRTVEDLLMAVRLADDAELWTRLADQADIFLHRDLPTDPEDHTQPLWETT